LAVCEAELSLPIICVSIGRFVMRAFANFIGPS
jgi:hypothetical protein